MSKQYKIVVDGKMQNSIYEDKFEAGKAAMKKGGFVISLPKRIMELVFE